MSLFALDEYTQRWRVVQNQMMDHRLDALLLTQEVDFAYLVGFHTRFWQSPTRPWFLILPQQGEPIAVIPAIGMHLMQQGIVKDIRSWSSPDLEDDGIGLLSEALEALNIVTLGLPFGAESYVRMPVEDYNRLQKLQPKIQFRDDANIMRTTRMIKSDAEITRIEAACDTAARAFARVHEIAHQGQRLDFIFRKFQMLCLDEGADFVPYLAGALDKAGYHDVISPAHQKKARSGDVLMLDAGLIKDGYFCDFNRNFVFETVDQDVMDAHRYLLDATQNAIEHMRPGTTIQSIYEVMRKTLSKDRFHASPGRMGHGLGLYLTEWPSIIATETMPLQTNMVMTIEPCIEMPNGKILVHEDNVVINENGARRLTPSYPEMMIL